MLETLDAPGAYTIGRVHNFVHVGWPERFAISVAAVLPMWRAVLRYARERHLRRVLVEGHAPAQKLRPVEAFRLGACLAAGSAPALRVAFCLYEYESDAVTWLFTQTANEGACAVRFFHDLSASLRWVGVRRSRSKFTRRGR